MDHYGVRPHLVRKLKNDADIMLKDPAYLVQLQIRLYFHMLKGEMIRLRNIDRVYLDIVKSGYARLRLPDTGTSAYVY